MGKKNLIGYEFGDYIVDSFDNTKGKYKYYWHCHCKHCGAEKSIATHSIETGKSSRCNQCNKNFGKMGNLKGFQENLSGQRFGNLTVIEFSHKENTHSYWLCRCDCGEFCIKSITFLRKSKNKMCQNCIQKYSNIANIIRDENIDEIGRVKTKVQFTASKNNKYEFVNDYVIINDKILIDKIDYDFIDSFDRYISIDSRGYAYFSYGNKDIYLHRLLTGTDLFYDEFDGKIADHINGNALDNRRNNLRVIDRRENPINCCKRKDNLSGCKGVSWLERLQKWQVNIQYKKQNYYIGVFENIEDAVAARKQAELKYFGDLNRSEQ